MNELMPDKVKLCKYGIDPHFRCQDKVKLCKYGIDPHFSTGITIVVLVIFIVLYYVLGR